jgi:hypothetical protein
VNFRMRERNHAFLDHRETKLKSKRVIKRKKDVQMRCLFCDFFIKCRYGSRHFMMNPRHYKIFKKLINFFL